MGGKHRKRGREPVGVAAGGTRAQSRVAAAFEHALNLHRTGNLDAARAAYRAVLDRDARHVQARCSYAMLLSQMGDYAGAVAEFRQAAEFAPRDADIRLQMALSLMATGALAAARRSCEQGIHLAPENLAARQLLAEINERLDDIPAGIRSYQAILGLRHDLPAIHNNLGILYRRSGDALAALRHYNDALAIDPGYAVAWNNRGNVCKDLGRLELAVASYHQALAIDPRYTEAQFNLGLAHQQTGRIAEAVAAFEKIPESDPEYEKARLQIAETLASAGRFAHAREVLDEILRQNRRCAEAYYLRAQQQRHAERDRALLGTIEALLAEPGLDEKQRVFLEFALAKMLDDLGDYDTAFAWLASANRRQRALIVEHDEFEHLIPALMAVYSREFLAVHAGAGHPSRAPIFVVGMPRAGTTLVEQCLAEHPEICAAGELDFFRGITQTLQQRLGTMQPYPETSVDLNAAALAAIGDEFLDAVRGRLGTARYVVDKMPENYLHLGLIKSVFPHARIVHCRRNPLDTCLSIYFQRFSGRHPYAYDLKEIGTRYLHYSRLMEHWRAVLGDAIHEIDYEDLVTDRERVIRALLAYCGLTWDEKCLVHERGQRVVATASRWQVRQPIYRDAIGRWRHYAGKLDVLNAILAPLVEHARHGADGIACE